MNSVRELAELTLERTIGKGTFGMVRRAVHMPTGRPVAVKVLQKSRIVSKGDAERVKREMGVLR